LEGKINSPLTHTWRKYTSADSHLENLSKVKYSAMKAESALKAESAMKMQNCQFSSYKL
jgi:hypothetical protein